MPQRPRVLPWLTPAQIDLVRDVAAHAGFDIAAAGSPVPGQSATVAGALGCPVADDLRRALHEADADLLWLAAAGDFGASAHDAAAVLAARSRGVRVACLTPVPFSTLDLTTAGWLAEPAPAKALRFVGLPRLGRAFRDAADVLTHFGRPRSVHVELWSREAHGGLGARVFAGIDTIFALLGEPESVAALSVAPDAEQGRRVAVPDRLPDLCGELTASFRFADGRLASLVASDAAARWNTSVTLVAAAGRLRFYDDGFEWVGPDGRKRDEVRLRHRHEPPVPEHDAAALSDQLARLLDPAAPDRGPLDLHALLSIAQAALLAARTGHAESPATIARMAETG